MKVAKRNLDAGEAQTHTASPEENHKLGGQEEPWPLKGQAASKNRQIGILVFLAVTAFLYFAQTVVLPILLAVIGAMVLDPLIEWMGKARIPRPLGAGIVLGLFVCGTGFGFVELSGPAIGWVKDAPQHLEKLKERANEYLPADKIKQAADALEKTSASSSSTNKVQSVEVKDHAGAGRALNWTAGLAGGFIETFVLIYMLLVLGEPMFGKMLDGKSSHERQRLQTIAREIQITISKYLFTITGINICLGIAVALGMWLFHVPNPAIWGVMAMLLNYVPYFGPIVGIVIVGIVSLLTFDSLPRCLLPTGWYLLLHLAEADYLTPVILGQRFTVSPVIVFISLMFATWLWGGVGALLAAPILISLKVLCQRIPAMAPGNRFL